MKSILVAYDGTDPARKALSEAIGFAKQCDATISVVSVVPIHRGRVPIDPWDNRAIHTAQLKEAREILAEAGISANVLEPVGDPAHARSRSWWMTWASTPWSSGPVGSAR